MTSAMPSVSRCQSATSRSSCCRPAGEFVELGFTAGVRAVPLGIHPAAVLEAVERRIQRALRHLEQRAGKLRIRCAIA